MQIFGLQECMWMFCFATFPLVLTNASRNSSDY